MGKVNDNEMYNVLCFQNWIRKIFYYTHICPHLLYSKRFYFAWLKHSIVCFAICFRFIHFLHS